jgi:hypothetical protein
MRARRLVPMLLVATLVVTTALVVLDGDQSARPVAASAEAPDGFVRTIEPRRVYDSRESGAPLSSSATGVEHAIDVFGPLGASSDVIGVFANITIDRPTSDGFLTAFPAGRSRPDASTTSFESGITVANATVLARGSTNEIALALVTPGVAGSAHVIVDVFAVITSDPIGSGRIASIDPGRVYDSRTSTPFASGESRRIRLTGASLSGSSAVVPTDGSAVAVAVNVTAVNDLAGSRSTWIGTSNGTSVLNVEAGDVAANFALVPLRADGSIELLNASGSTHLVVDVWGYVTTSGVTTTAPGRVVLLDVPFRAVDSRPTRLGAGRAEPWDFSAFEASLATDRTGFSSADALLGNVTATGLTRRYPGLAVSSFLTVYPTGTARPSTSNVNIGEGETVATLGLLRLGSDSLSVYNDDGSVDYVIDVLAVITG